MKTKEEILAQKTDWVCEQPFSKLKQNILEAMQLYSDQQNKEKDAEIQRLTKEVEELKESKEKRISELTAVGMGKQQEIDDTKQSIKNLQCRIQELERFSGWKDMEPHHPIGSNLGYGEIGKEPALGVVSLELFGWKITNEDEPWSIEHLGNKFKAVDDEGKVKAAKTLQELITEIAEEQDDFRNRQEDALSKNIEAKEKAVEEYSKKFQQYHDACILKDKERSFLGQDAASAINEANQLREQNAQLRKEWEAYHKKTLEEQWGLAEETIIRLRKEIEEYKVVVKNYDKVSGEKTETITRLTELLRRAKTRLKLIKKAPYAWHQVTDKLLTEIENAIKP